MKKIVYIILLFVISFLSVTSCKKTEKKIIGKWKVYYADVYSDTMFTNKSLPDDTWTFRNNGTVVSTAGFYSGIRHYDCIECKFSCKKKKLYIYDGDLSFEKSYGNAEMKGKFVFNGEIELDIDKISKQNDKMYLSGIFIKRWYEEYTDYKYPINSYFDSTKSAENKYVLLEKF